MDRVPPESSPEGARDHQKVITGKHRSWMMTLWSHEDVERLKGLGAAVLVIGEEVCPSTGRLHFHAYVRFEHARRATPLYVLFPNVDIKPLWTTEAKAVQYVTKGGKVVFNSLEMVGVGVPPVVEPRVVKLNKKGEVEVEVHRRLREGETIRSIWSDHPIYCARNMRMLRSVVRVYELWGHRDDAMTSDNLSGVEL